MSMAIALDQGCDRPQAIQGRDCGLATVRRIAVAGRNAIRHEA